MAKKENKTNEVKKETTTQVEENLTFSISPKTLKLVKNIGYYTYKTIMLIMVFMCTMYLSQITNYVDAIGYQQYLIYTNDSSTNTNTSTVTTPSESTDEEDIQQYADALEATAYFKEHKRTLSAIEDVTTLSTGDYFVYLYQTGCSACAYTDFYLLQYIEQSVYETEGDIYFVDIASQSYDWLWTSSETEGIGSTVTNIALEDIKVQGTPTILHVNSNGTIDGAVGVDAVLEMLGISFE